MKLSRLICAAIALIPASALASGPFDGVWKFDANHIQLSKKPLVISLVDGHFTCASCAPPDTIAADGTDQKVAASTFDTVVVTVVGPSEVDVLHKLKGKTLTSIKTMIASDGATAVREYTDYSGAAPISFKIHMKRVAPAPAGAHAFSGSWVETGMDSLSEAGTLETLGITDDGFTMSGNGQSYDAKFDGKKYPVTGDPTMTMVTVKHPGPNEVVETDFRKGKTVEVVHFTVSADGKTISVVDTDVLQHSTDRYKLFKQP